MANPDRKQILILNGPNLNLLGRREPEIYGSQTFADFFADLQAEFPYCQLEHAQSNHEGELIDHLHRVGFTYDGVMLNAGGFTHTSVVLADAVAGIDAPVVEVHISNPAAREPFRHTSLLARSVVGSISGFGLDSYRLALTYLLERAGRR